MNVPRAVLFFHFAIAASGFGCGAQSSGNGTRGAGDPALADASDMGGPSASDAVAPPGSSICSVNVSGAATRSWTSDWSSPSHISGSPSAGLSAYSNFEFAPSDAGGTNDLSIDCSPPATDAAPSDYFNLTFPSVAGPGTYAEGSVVLNTDSMEWGAPSACTLTLDTFSPANRGGMSGRFSCDPVENSDAYMEGDDPSTVTISGSFDFAPVPGQNAAAPADDGGPPPDDGDPTSCTMHIVGGSGTYDAETVGDGWAYDGTVTCEGTADGLYYSLIAVAPGTVEADDGAIVRAPSLDIEGPAFCGPRGDVSYGSSTPCTLDVLVEGSPDGGPFQATFDCQGLAVVGVPLHNPGEALRVTGTIDGILRPPRPPD